MPIQDILGGMTNASASRNAILQRLGIDPNRAAGYGGNTQFDTQMAELYNQGLKGSSDLDTEEGNLNRNYQQNYAQAAIDRDKALKQIIAGYANRGMYYSGANVEDQDTANQDFTRYTGNLGAERDAGLSNVGRNRINLESGLTQGKQALEGGYGADVGAFLQQQAVDLWNSVMQQNQQNAMMQAINRPAPAPAPVRAPAPVAPRVAAPVAPAPIKTGTLKGIGYGTGAR